MHLAAPRRQPRRVMARAVALSGTALLAAALLAWAPQPTTGWDQSSAEATLWQLLNGARVNNGLQPLTQHGTLVSLARWRSKDMVDRDYFDHTVLGTSWQIYHWYDSNGLNWSSGGENIGWNNGYADADSPIKIHEGFMNSAGHRANVLNVNWSHGGVGAYGADGVTWGGQVRNIRMYTQLFIKLNGGTPPPPPPPPTPAPTQPPATPKPPPKPTAVPTPVATPVPTPVPTAIPHQTQLETDAPVAQTASPAAAASVPAASASPPGSGEASPAPQVAVSPLRVEAADAAERGIFETVIASLLGFFLG